MRILHTADWHLGHTLHGYSREEEHRHFLKWLLDTLEEQRIDLLLIAGDVFDAANPPAYAQAMYFDFLAQVHRRLPSVEVVIIAGNHDSPSRLDASKPLLDAFGIHVVGYPTNMALRLRSGVGCAAVPFLRPADLPSVEGDDPLIEGVRAVYREVFDQLRDCENVIALGHAYMVGSTLSATSERKILGGNQHALPVDIFPETCNYVALGHLHRPQTVGGKSTVRYSGSPLPLALDEGRYEHQVAIIELPTGTVSTLATPRPVDIVRLPKQTLESALETLAEFSPEGNPYLELNILLEKPEPHLRHHLAKALADKEVRLCRIVPHYPGVSAKADPTLHLPHLSPDEIFRRRYQQCHEGEPPKELLALYHDLLHEVAP